MSDHEHTEPGPDERDEAQVGEEDLQEGQRGKGYGEDEGEREGSLPEAPE